MSTELTKPKATPDLNPKTTKLEFFGVPGTTLLVLTLPIIPYALYFGCSEEGGGCYPNVFDLATTLNRRFTTKEGLASLWDAEAATAWFGWMAYIFVTWAILPGDWVEGAPLRDGNVIKYKINALQTLLLTLGLVGGTIYQFGPQSFTFLHDHILGLITVTATSAYALALILYISSFYGNKLTALAGNSGWKIHDFWIGRELNPTIAGIDVKSLFELRPGMIGWVLINISCACEQAVRLGGRVTDSMVLVQVFQALYVFDALYNEPAILSQMDVTTDGLGLMLTFGDLCWLPLTYTLQARYLASNHTQLGLPKVAGILAVQFFGYWIFRSANAEKNDFRNGKNPKNLSFMETKRGTKLLTSGWWGLSRHPNYMGDLIMAFSWSLATGFNTPVTYFYVAYFTVLLVHRQRRDDEACLRKYGDDWIEYQKRVPYRIFPYIY